jgi:hypothetical protein
MAVALTEGDYFSGSQPGVVEDREECDEAAAARSVPGSDVGHSGKQFAGLRVRDDHARVYLVCDPHALGPDVFERVVLKGSGLDGVFDGGVETTLTTPPCVSCGGPAVERQGELVQNSPGNCRVGERADGHG